MNAAEKELWERIRAKGRGAYVLRHGVLRSGLLAGFLMALISFIFSPPHTTFDIYILTVKSAAMTLAIGAINGARNWNLKEGEYKETDEYVA